MAPCTELALKQGEGVDARTQLALGGGLVVLLLTGGPVDRLQTGELEEGGGGGPLCSSPACNVFGDDDDGGVDDDGDNGGVDDDENDENPNPSFYLPNLPQSARQVDLPQDQGLDDEYKEV